MFLIARHGKTQWNIEGRLQGWMNSPLTNIGRIQAEQLGKFIHSIDPIDSVYSSPLKRCKETLRWAGYEKQAIFIPEFKECSFGLMEGMYEEEAKKCFKDYWIPRDVDWQTKWLLPPPCGESYDDVYRRVNQGLEPILCNSINKRILIMTHGFTSRLIRGILMDRSPEEILKSSKQHNDEVFTIANKIEECIKL